MSKTELKLHHVESKDLYKYVCWDRGGIVASDSESRGPEFDPHWRHRVVSLSKAH